MDILSHVIGTVNQNMVCRPAEYDSHLLKLDYDMLLLATTDACQKTLPGEAPSCLQTRTGLAQQCKQHSLQTAALSNMHALFQDAADMLL